MGQVPELGSDLQGSWVREAAVPRPVAGPPPLAGRSAIFDLDRTICAGSSLVDLARVLVDDGLIKRSVVARHALLAKAFARRGASDAQVERLRRTALAMVAGCEEASLLRSAQVAGSLVARRAYPMARLLLEHHVAEGDFCVIVSAAPQPLVEAVVAQLGAHRAVGTQASVVDGRLTGEIQGPFCYGAGKLTRLRTEVGPIDLATAAGYADSLSDLPLLRACGRPVAVNPDRGLRREARRAQWPVLSFA
jgi:HAD superfamily hydrolase (TIGR01490 family)